MRAVPAESPGSSSPHWPKPFPLPSQLPLSSSQDSLPPPFPIYPKSAHTAVPYLTLPFWPQTSYLTPLAKPLLLSPVFRSLPGVGLSSSPVMFPPVALDASSSMPSTYPSLKPSMSLLSLLKLFLLLGVASLIPSHLTTPPPPAHYLYRHEC